MVGMTYRYDRAEAIRMSEANAWFTASMADAFAQMHRREKDSGEKCHVYRNGEVWCVRTTQEGVPVGAVEGEEPMEWRTK